MTVVVTGGAGFLGSHLVPRLLAQGHTVHVVDDLSRARQLGMAPHLPDHPRLAVTVMDLASPQAVEWLQRLAPARVFHLAANADVHSGVDHVETDLRLTLMTTLHVLEGMRLCGCRNLVFASSATVYGEGSANANTSPAPLRPISLYGAAKAAAEAYVHAFSHLHGMRAWVLRLPNVVGPNLTHGVVLDLVAQLRHNPRRLKVRGSGRQAKSFLDVEDMCRGVMAALDHAPAVYDLPGNGTTTVAQVADMVRHAMGLPEAEVEYDAGEPGWPGDVCTPHMASDRPPGWLPEGSSHQAVHAAIAAEVARTSAVTHAA